MASIASILTGIDLKRAAIKLAKKVELVGTPKIEIEEYNIGGKTGKNSKNIQSHSKIRSLRSKNAEIFIALMKLGEKQM
ncbi:MAG: hypothetical protein QXI56_08685 [Candidatus Bathyarchaeia archaeon]